MMQDPGTLPSVWHLPLMCHYLLHSPDDRAGALGFGLNQAPPAPCRKFNQTMDLERLQELADLIIADEDLPDSAEAEQAQK